MSRPIGFITLEAAREILGDDVDVNRLIEELLISRHVGTDGVVAVRKSDVVSLASIFRNPLHPRESNAKS